MQRTASSRTGASACTVNSATILEESNEIRFEASGSLKSPRPRNSPRRYRIGKDRLTKGGA